MKKQSSLGVKGFRYTQPTDSGCVAKGETDVTFEKDYDWIAEGKTVGLDEPWQGPLYRGRKFSYSCLNFLRYKKRHVPDGKEKKKVFHAKGTNRVRGVSTLSLGISCARERRKGRSL